jgi:micrococcal nuclease
MARSRAVLVAVATVLLGAVGGWWAGGEPATYAARVIETIDGDTIVVRFHDGSTETVRILGIDTPETEHPTIGVECFGPEAKAATRDRLLGEAVRLEFDIERRDRYGRLLAHLWHGGELYGETLLRDGLAEWYVLPPNGLHQRSMLRTELEAQAAGRGLWSAC